MKITLNGRIDSNNFQAVQREIMAKLEEKPGEDPIFDAMELEYISSAGLRILMSVRKKFGKPLVIENVSRDVYDIFEMTGFTELFDVNKRLREISVDGAEIIGRGCYGTVYRIDEELVVKVYESESAIPMIKNEQKLSKVAFVKGIPTAISYDIVKVGDKYGSMFELLNASTYTAYLRDNPDKADGIIQNYVNLLKQVHSSVLDPGCCPSANQKFLSMLENVRDCLGEDKYKQIKYMLEAVPESQTAVHGDCHLSNIMMVDNEPLLIDMDTLSMGNPVFELSGIFYTYIAFEEDDPGNTELFHGITAEIAEHIWDLAIRLYFEGDDEATIEDKRNRIMLLGWLHFLDSMLGEFKGSDLSDIRTKHSIEHISELLPKVKELGV